MVEYLEELHRISNNIANLEEEHNYVLDAQHHLKQQVHNLDSEVHEHITRIKKDILALRQDIHKRISQAKRATVILSLLGQQDELTRVQQRADKQPYEFYATSKWFAQLLDERFGSSKSNS